MNQARPSAAAGEAPSTADAGRRRDRRPVVLGALGALALTATGVLLLSGGSEATDAALATPAAATATGAAAPEPTTTPAATAPAGTAPAAGAEVRPGRDPFEVLRAGAAAPVVVAPVVAAPVDAAPVLPAPTAAVPAQRTLSLQAVEAAGGQQTAVFTLAGTSLRAEVGARFGPAGELLLVSLQPEPGGTGWSAVVRHAGGRTFDVTTGRHAHLP